MALLQPLLEYERFSFYYYQSPSLSFSFYLITPSCLLTLLERPERRLLWNYLQGNKGRLLLHLLTPYPYRFFHFPFSLLLIWGKLHHSYIIRNYLPRSTTTITTIGGRLSSLKEAPTAVSTCYPLSHQKAVRFKLSFLSHLPPLQDYLAQPTPMYSRSRFL